jgi:uncharacterized protein YprB with RNaseH-like and TPR domain
MRLLSTDFLQASFNDTMLDVWLVHDDKSNMSAPKTCPHIRPSEATAPWVYQAATSKSATFPRTGKWMLFYLKKDMDIAWNTAVMAFNDEKLDGVHSMKASSLNYDNPRASDKDKGVLIFYCGGSEDDVVMIGELILKVMQYCKNHSVPFVYYKLNEQTAQGTAATGSTKNWTYKLSCAVCTERIAVQIEPFHIKQDTENNKTFLKHSFQHIKGVGPKKEDEMWKNGIIDHETYLKRNDKAKSFVSSNVNIISSSFDIECNLVNYGTCVHNHPDEHITEILERLGYSKGINANDDNHCCLRLAFKDAGVEDHVLEAMKTEFLGRKIAPKNIRKIAEDHKLYVRITTDGKTDGYGLKYGPRDGFPVELALIKEHYIHNFKTDVCSYAFKHYDELKDKEEWWRYCKAKEKAKEGERGIKALPLIRLLLDSNYVICRGKKGIDNIHTDLCESVIQTQHALSNNLVNIFFEGLHPKEQWKIYGDFQDNTCYFDIESTGLAIGHDTITTAVVYSHAHTFFFVDGINLDYLPFVLNQYQIVVSYNGKCFDVPFVHATWRHCKVTTKHLDLRHILTRLNVTGGLKRCEEQLGLPKREEEDVNGAFAPDLWREYKSKGKMEPLRKLLSYNFEDASRLRHLMVKAYNLNISKNQFPFDVSNIQEPDMAKNPFLSCETHNVLDIVKKSTDILVSCT